MMLQKIKEAQLAARKARNTVTATLLTTLIGEVESQAKSAANRAPTDVEVLGMLKKFEKNMLENVRIYTEANMPDKVEAAEAELDIIRDFLPQKIEDAEVLQDMKALIDTLILPMEMRSLGTINKMLKAKYGDQFDGQQASRIFKELF